ncbi:MAG: M16 family metallopeptidase, partial [Leadbetterella sp.]
VAVVGNISKSQVLRVCERYLKDIQPKSNKIQRTAPDVNPVVQIVEQKDNHQAQVALGRQSYSLYNKNRLPFFTLVNLLGGPGLNSRFNLSLREKYGLVYSIEATYTGYSDTGFFGIFFGTDHQNVDKALKLIYRELEHLKEKKLGSLQLKSLKDQLKGQLAMAEESHQGYMLMMAKSILDLEKVEQITDIFREIDIITSTKLQDLANEMFDNQSLSSLVYK